MYARKIKVTVVWKLKRAKSGIIQMFFSMAEDAHNKMLILLKGHFTIFQNRYSISVGRSAMVPILSGRFYIDAA